MAGPSPHVIQVKGSAIRSRLLWVKEMYGAVGLWELVQDLSPAGRNVARGDIDPRAWYNLPLFIELCTAVDKRFGKGDLALNVELARWGCHVNTPTLYQAFIRLGSVDWVLQKSTKFWHEHFSAGQLVVRHEPGANRAEAEILEFPALSLALAYSVVGFAIGCIELSGGKDVTGEVVSARTRGADRDLLRVAWT